MKSITLNIAAATTLPLELETVKSDLRISGAELDASLVDQYIPSALAFAEGFCKRAIVARTIKWIFDDFPKGSAQAIELPRGKVNSIASIVYYSSGSPVTLTGPTSGSPAGTDWQEDLSGHVARIMPPRTEDWPGDVDADVIKPVEITFNGGWSTIAEIPADLKRALTAHVHIELEKVGLVDRRAGFDFDFVDKLLTPFRTV